MLFCVFGEMFKNTIFIEHLRVTEKILQSSYLKWIFLSKKITRRLRKWLKNQCGSGKRSFWKLILTMVIFVISQGNEAGLGMESVILKEWEVISLTFLLSSWKGKSTSKSSFVRFSHSISDNPTVRF